MGRAGVQVTTWCAGDHLVLQLESGTDLVLQLESGTDLVLQLESGTFRCRVHHHQHHGAHQWMLLRMVVPKLSSAQAAWPVEPLTEGLPSPCRLWMPACWTPCTGCSTQSTLARCTGAHEGLCGLGPASGLSGTRIAAGAPAVHAAAAARTVILCSIHRWLHTVLWVQ